MVDQLEYEHLAFPDNIAIEFLYDALLSEELALGPVGSANRVLEHVDREIVHSLEVVPIHRFDRHAYAYGLD